MYMCIPFFACIFLKLNSTIQPHLSIHYCISKNALHIFLHLTNAEMFILLTRSLKAVSVV